MPEVNNGQQPLSSLPSMGSIADLLGGLAGADKALSTYKEDLSKSGIDAQALANRDAGIVPEQQQGGDDSQGQEGDQQADAEGQQAAAAVIAEAPAAEAPAAAEGGSVEIDSPLFGGKVNLGKKKGEAIDIKDFEGAAQAITKSLGIEVKDVADIAKVIKSAETWRKDAQKAGEVQKEYDTLEKIFTGLPQNFLDAIQAHYRGEDWKSPLAVTGLDYNKKLTEQDEKALVNHYFPGKFTEDDFSDDEDNPKAAALEIAMAASKDKYQNEKGTFDKSRADKMQNATARQSLVRNSIVSSVSGLEKAFPNMAIDTKTDVKKILEGGTEKIMGLFVNTDGTYKEEAAQNLVLALYGKKVIDDLTEIAVNKAVTSEREEMLERGAEKPGSTAKSGKQVAPISKDFQAYIDNLAGGLAQANKKTY